MRHYFHHLSSLLGAPAPHSMHEYEIFSDQGADSRSEGPATLTAQVLRRKSPRLAEVAELADAQDSGSCARKGVEVRVLSSANE